MWLNTTGTSRPAGGAGSNGSRSIVPGSEPARNEVAVKSRVAYVPDQVAFYPWMTVRETLAYVASFRERWNREIEAALLTQFQLDGSRKTNALSKGQRTQLALVTAVCAEPDLLVLDEPTRGVDPERKASLAAWLHEYAAAGRAVLVATHDASFPTHRRVRLGATEEVPVAV